MNEAAMEYSHSCLFVCTCVCFYWVRLSQVSPEVKHTNLTLVETFEQFSKVIPPIIFLPVVYAGPGCSSL